MNTNAQKEWQEYCAHELDIVKPLLTTLGYHIDAEQPHTVGERYLMQAVTTASGRKLVLLGTRTADGKRVVIKTTNDPKGIQELTHERTCRNVLENIRFAYQVFHSPKELFFGTRGGRLIAIQEFIPQEISFLARPLAEQFSLALESFKAQESAHATTYGHARLVARTFGSMPPHKYLDTFDMFKRELLKLAPGIAAEPLLTEAREFLSTHREVIEQYSGFLTHTDFVPHNFRIHDGNIYLLDHSSLRFGNKYEGWARFLNFMTLYNPALAEALTAYVRLNRTPEELLSLKLMRLYRLGEISWYYANTLDKCEGNLCMLNAARVKFWSTILKHVLADKSIPPEVIEEYKKTRDSLRSEDEKKRQKGLH